MEEYFDHQGKSPYMSFVKPIANNRRIPYPENFEPKTLFEKLYFLRSDMPAITHVDYSARIQTVHKETNLCFWKLLHAFKKITGCPVMINTSFNLRDEPIVNTPEDAYKCFMRTEMDYLVIGNFIFNKENQPKFEIEEKWKKKSKLD